MQGTGFIVVIPASAPAQTECNGNRQQQSAPIKGAHRVLELTGAIAAHLPQGFAQGFCVACRGACQTMKQSRPCSVFS